MKIVACTDVEGVVTASCPAKHVHWNRGAGPMADSTGHEYFSDRESGSCPRVHQDFTEPAWSGLVALVHRLIGRGDFGNSFPDRCFDQPYPPIGTDPAAFNQALKAEVPNWPGWESKPDVATACDFLEFCFRHVALASPQAYHDFGRHHHLRFDIPGGQASFVAEVNLLLQRNQIALELEGDGRMRRLLDDPTGHAVMRARFRTGDPGLDRLLEEARLKFISPNPRVRQEAMERAWDAWERLKTVKDSDKRRGVRVLLDAVATDPVVRQMLEDEARVLTGLGNSLHIRHSETTQVEIGDLDLLDYLFQRQFAFMLLVLRKNSMLL